MSPVSQNDLNWYAARLAIAVYDTNHESPEMSVQSLKAALHDVNGSQELNITYAPNGNQLIHIDGKTIEVGPMASNDEIKAALQNPFVPTLNTKVSMTSPLQGLGDRLKKLEHDTELDANKLVARIDSVSARKDAAVAKANQGLDTKETNIKDIEDFVTTLEKATNGPPA